MPTKKTRNNEPKVLTRYSKKQFDLIDKLTAVFVIIGALLASAFGSDQYHLLMITFVFLTICIALFDLFRHINHRKRWYFFSLLVLVSAISCGIWEIQHRHQTNKPSKELEPITAVGHLKPLPKTKAVTPLVKPDISLRIVNPQAMSIVVVNDSKAIIRDARYSFIVWNLEADKADSFPIIDRTADWIRPTEFIYPESFLSPAQISSFVKNGDRLIGIADAGCPDCLRTKSYWVYLIHGQGGWFAESPENKYPNIRQVSKLIPQIRKNPESFFRDIPQDARIPIATDYP